jgi:hypothetical protein
MTVNLSVMTPAISIAPQKDISPSPSAKSQRLLSETHCIKLTGEMQITTAELGTLDKHRQVHLATPGKVLNVTISTVFWSAWNSPCTLFADLLLELSRCRSSMHALWFWWLRNDAFEASSAYEVGLSFIPFGKNFVRRSTPKNARVYQTSEADARNVSRGAENPFKVPDGLCPGTNSQLGILG